MSGSSHPCIDTLPGDWQDKYYLLADLMLPGKTSLKCHDKGGLSRFFKTTIPVFFLDRCKHLRELKNTVGFIVLSPKKTTNVKHHDVPQTLELSEISD